MNRSEFEAEFNEALALKNAGNFHDALDKLYELAMLESAGRRHPAVIGVIAGILYYELEDIEQAMPFLVESVSLSPESVRASLALFHALFEQGETDKAFDEMKRFVSSVESGEYNELIENLEHEMVEKLNERNLTREDKTYYELIVQRLREIKAARRG